MALALLLEERLKVPNRRRRIAELRAQRLQAEEEAEGYQGEEDSLNQELMDLLSQGSRSNPGSPGRMSPSIATITQSEQGSQVGPLGDFHSQQECEMIPAGN